MTSRHQKTSIKIAKDRLIRKVNEFNAVKLELIQSIEKSSKSAIIEVEAVLHHDGEDRCRFHELYGNANKSIEACMFKLLEVRDALNNDSGDEQLDDNYGTNELVSCEDSVKSKDINDTNVSGDQFFKHLLNKQPDVCDSSNINNQTPRTSSPSGAVNEVAENKVQHISQKPKLPANHLTAVKSVSKCDSTDVGESVSNREETPRIFDVAQLIYDCKTLEENYLKDGHLQQVEINGRTNENNYETSASCDIQEVQKVEKEKVDVSCIAMGEDSALELNKKGVEAGTLVIGTAVSSGDACVQTANVLLDNSPCQMPSECNTEVNNFPNDCHFELIPVLSIEDGCVIDGLITHIESPLSFHFHILTSDYKISFLNSDLSEYYQESRPLLRSKPKRGVLCAVISESSGSWMRAVVVETENINLSDTNDELVTVRFIDFGFTEIHPLSHLRELDASFLQIPCLSIHCRLHGINPPPPHHDWNKIIVDLFRDLSVKQEIKAKVVRKMAMQYEVELLLNKMNVEVSISHCLLDPSLDIYVKKDKASHSESPYLSDTIDTNELSQFPEPLSNDPDRRNCNITHEFDEIQNRLLSNSSDIRHYYESIVNRFVSDRSIQNEEPMQFQIQDLKLPQDFTTIEAMLANVVSPDEFYIHPVIEVVACIDLLSEDLNDTCATSLPLFIDTSDIPVGSFWCAKFPFDGSWYRAKVLHVKEVKIDNELKVANSDIIILMFFIDYGDSAWVSIRDIRPLPAKFYRLPALAVRCQLYNVRPSSRVTESGPKSDWSPEAAIRMKEWAGEQVLKIHVYRFQDTSDIKVYDVLLWNLQESAFHEVLIKCGLAKPEIMQNSEPIFPSGGPVSSSGSMNDILDDYDLTDLDTWNPMDAEYNSLRNSYNVDVDDAGVALTGYKARDERDICFFYQRGQLCKRGNYCPYKHIIPRNDGLTTDKKELVCIRRSVEIPVIGNSIPVEVTSLNKPFIFYVNFLLSSNKSGEEGAKSSETSTEDLYILWEAMQKTYQNSSLREGDYLLRAEGELVAAKFSKDNAWYRGRVIGVSNEYNLVKIYFVDYGGTEWVREENIRDLKVEFTHLSCQAVACQLANIEFFEDCHLQDEARKFFRRQVEDKKLVAHIVDVVGETIFIDLFNVTSGTAINIALAMVNAGFAKHQYKKTRVSTNKFHRLESKQYFPA